MTTQTDTAIGLGEASGMFLHATNIRHVEDHKLEVAFNDGTTSRVDFEDELYGEVFKQTAINEETNTVEWPNGADFAPEFLHEAGEEVQQAV